MCCKDICRFANRTAPDNARKQILEEANDQQQLCKAVRFAMSALLDVPNGRL